MNTTQRITLAVCATLVLVLGALLVWTWLDKTRLTDDLDLAQATVTAERERAEERAADYERTLSELADDHDRALVELNTEWTDRYQQARAENDARMGQLFAQFNEIIHDGAQTAAYIRGLETRLLDGQSLAIEEIESLRLIAGSLSYLREQYQKPLAEFRELEEFLIRQLDIPPMPPGQRGAFFRRIFSRDYREQELEYQRDLGRQEAFETARRRVVETYDRAQRRMAAIQLDTDATLARLREIIDGKEADTEALGEFLRTSHRMLDVHAEVMRLRDEPVAAGDPGGTAP